MEAAIVVDLYRELTRAGIAVWVDGGWAIDAALGRQTRHIWRFRSTATNENSDRLLLGGRNLSSDRGAVWSIC